MKSNGTAHGFKMACVEVKKIIQDFSSYFGKKIDDLSFSFDKVPVARIGKNEVRGLRNIVSQVSSPVDPEYDVVQDEWVEYALIHIGNLESSAVAQVLKDLNNYIMDKVYFVGNQLGPVDVLLYYILYSTVLTANVSSTSTAVDIISRSDDYIVRDVHTIRD